MSKLKKNDALLNAFFEKARKSGQVVTAAGLNASNKSVIEVAGKVEGTSVNGDEVTLMLGGVRVLIGVSGSGELFLNSADVAKVKLSTSAGSVEIGK